MNNISKDKHILDDEFKKIFEIEEQKRKQEFENEFLRTATVGLHRVIGRHIESSNELVQFLQDASGRIQHSNSHDEDFKYKELGVATGICIGVLEQMVKRDWNEDALKTFYHWFGVIKQSIEKQEHKVSTEPIKKRTLKIIKEHGNLSSKHKTTLKKIATLF
ncbi:MAG: hypothetical protein ACQESC_02015 [Nanobdellota archaeon]